MPRSALQKALSAKMPSLEVADRVFARLNVKSALPTTLKFNVDATRQDQKKTAAAVQNENRGHTAGTVLAHAQDEHGKPLTIDDTALEKLEARIQDRTRDHRPFSSKLSHSLAVFGMYVALYVLVRLLHLPSRSADCRRPGPAGDAVRADRRHGDADHHYAQRLAGGNDSADAVRHDGGHCLRTGNCIAALGGRDAGDAVALGYGLADAIVLLAATAGAILLLGRVRSRSKLLSVGFLAAGVAAFTTIGVGTLEGTPHDAHTSIRPALLAVWAVIAGSLMTCLLPMVEKVFSVQTDLSLIELGDPAHPLLQELIRRAPGTYNHSITVASLAEAAAEAIGARGLLVRVGAYFHDIGKMLKPGYFAENQGQGDNRHRSLVPAMSTLVIIAHVKDGADLARQSKIPEPIIDFIQQHHGTTLVEYFYRQASESKKANPDGSEVDESSFRYPGPKPQTKEAGILMLADAVESASRVLVEPTPSRIESLVEDISRKRLLDGQFDECGLTLEEVRKIGDSLVKSLTAVYHGRVKYPDQETA